MIPQLARAKKLNYFQNLCLIFFINLADLIEDLFNGLQVNGEVFDREFTKILIIRDFDDVLKNPFRYVHLFLLHKLLSKKNSENRHARPVTEGPKLRCNTPPP